MGTLKEQRKAKAKAKSLVSIQLMSPASGDDTNGCEYPLRSVYVSIQLMSPASGDSPSGKTIECSGKFPFN